MIPLGADTGSVIPTLILVGLVFGRWWRITIPAAAVGWVALLLVDHLGSGFAFALGAGLLAAANTAVGVLLFQGVRALVSFATRRS